MAAAPARALAADKRSHPLRLLILSPISISLCFHWVQLVLPDYKGLGFIAAGGGFAAAAAAPGRAPAAGVDEAAPKPTNLPSQRGALPWGDKPMPPAPNAWGSSSFLSLKKGEGSGSFVNINDHPSSLGSSSTSTDESDSLDSPVSCGRTSHDSVTVISRPQSTELRPGSWKFAHSQISFLDVLKAPLRTIAKKRPTSHRKGFTICADDFPVLDSKNSQSNGQQGHCFQGRPSFSSVVITARDEQRKTPLTGGDPVSTVNFSSEPEQAQPHATQTPDICMPPPCIDYWHRLLITLLTGMEFVLEELYHMVRASLQTRLSASLLNHLLMTVNPF